jgi:hypothetical protein
MDAPDAAAAVPAMDAEPADDSGAAEVDTTTTAATDACLDTPGEQKSN